MTYFLLIVIAWLWLIGGHYIVSLAVIGLSPSTTKTEERNTKAAIFISILIWPFTVTISIIKRKGNFK